MISILGEGILMGMSEGTAKLTAKINNLTDTCRVTVLGQREIKTQKPVAPTKPVTPTTPSGDAYLQGASAWARDEVQSATDCKLTYSAILNNYQRNITRAEFCKLVVNLYKANEGKLPTVGASPFTDTSDPDVISANKLGIATGVSNSRFAPNADITREEIAVMTMRAFKLFDTPNIKNDLQRYADFKKIFPWAVESLAFFNQTEIIKGMSQSEIAAKTMQQGSSQY